MTPWRSKNLPTLLWVKKNLQNPKKYLEPLDLAATVGQSCMCVCVCVCVNDEEQRCGGVTLKSPKKHISEKTRISLSHYLSLNKHSNSQKH